MGKREIKTPVLLCPVCGRKLTPNKGWAAQFYDGYCNYCDMPVEDAIGERQRGGKTQWKRKCMS